MECRCCNSRKKPHPATQFLTENATNPHTITSYNDVNADKGKMFYFTHTLNEGTENEKTITETRYIGNVPKNYVYFNCVDSVDGEEYNYATNCEKWRILGVFDIEKEIDDPGHAEQKIIVTEQRMKLVRGTDFATIMYGNNGSNNNDWTNISLKIYLNETYYNSLTSSAQSQIEDAIFYLGGKKASSLKPYYGTTEEIYKWERGTTLCKSCGTDNNKLIWEGVNTTCYNDPWSCNNGASPGDSWVFKSNVLEGKTTVHSTRFLSPVADEASMYHMRASGNMNRINVRDYSDGVRPVVYLSADIQIFDGDGSEGNPYKLK